jgi:hypothetical protein
MAGKTLTQLITTALRTVGDTNLTAEALEWFDEVQDEIEQKAFWRWLYKSTTHQTVNNQRSVLFSASEFPSAALADYSKGLRISSNQEPYNLDMLSKADFDKITPVTGAPEVYALEGGAPGSEKLWLHPTPITGATTLPLLTLDYYKQITRATGGSDDVQVTLGIPRRFNAAIINGLIAIGSMERDEKRALRFLDLFEKKITGLIIENDDFFTDKESRFDRSSLLQKSTGLNVPQEDRS